MNIERQIDSLALSDVVGMSLVAASSGYDAGLRAALWLTFSNDTTLVIRAVSLDDSISVQTEQLDATAQLEGELKLQAFVGRTAFNWWAVTNDESIVDGIIIAFAPDRGVLLSVMASEIQIMEICGDQFA